MKYLSVCSGIEAATVAWEPLGWEAVSFSEIDAFPRAVLAHHYPHVPLHGDFTELIEQPPACDVLVGGTPCQAFSVAGARRSLADARGNLTLAYVMLADAIDRRNREEGKEPCIAVWENVPGVLSTRDNAFGCFLSRLAGEDVPLEPAGGRWSNAGVVVGPARTISWRTLDAQYFGVAQRRRRVFVVASARAGFDPSALLFEYEGVRRDSAPSRTARESPAARSRRSAAAVCVSGDVTHTLKADGFDASEDGTGRGQPIVPAYVNGSPYFSFQSYGQYDCSLCGSTIQASIDVTTTDLIAQDVQVRRLTPRECERLQGFPDDYTLIPWKNRPASDCPDGPRYKALGNSMAVPCMAWIGQRLAEQARLLQTRRSL